MWRKGSHFGLRSTSDEAYLPERSVAFEEPPTITMHQIATILEISSERLHGRTHLFVRHSPAMSGLCLLSFFLGHATFEPCRAEHDDKGSRRKSYGTHNVQPTQQAAV